MTKNENYNFDILGRTKSWTRETNTHGRIG